MCRDSDGETGFYDLVSNKFIRKALGSFIAGPALKVIDGDTVLSGAYMWLLGGTGGNTTSNEGSGDYNYFCTNTKLYDFQVSNGGEVQCHFVPVKRASDGVVGIYDIGGDLGFVEATIAGTGTVTAGEETGESFTIESDTVAPVVIRKVRFASAAEAESGITLKGGALLQSTLVLGAKNGAVDMTNVALAGNIRVAPALAEGAATPVLANALVIPDGTNVVAFAGFASPLALSVDLSQFDLAKRKSSIPLVSAGGTAPDADNITVAGGLPHGWKLLPSGNGSHLEATRLRSLTIYIR